MDMQKWEDKKHKEARKSQRLHPAESILQVPKEKPLLPVGKLHLVLPEQVTFTIMVY